MSLGPQRKASRPGTDVQAGADKLNLKKSVANKVKVSKALKKAKPLKMSKTKKMKGY